MPNRTRRHGRRPDGHTAPPDPQHLNRLYRQIMDNISAIIGPGLQPNLQYADTLTLTIRTPARRCFNLAVSVRSIISRKSELLSAWDAAQRHAESCRDEARAAAVAAIDAGQPGDILKFRQIAGLAGAATTDLKEIIRLIEQAKRAGRNKPFQEKSATPTA